MPKKLKELLSKTNDKRKKIGFREVGRGLKKVGTKTLDLSERIDRNIKTDFPTKGIEFGSQINVPGKKKKKKTKSILDDFMIEF